MNLRELPAVKVAPAKIALLPKVRRFMKGILDSEFAILSPLYEWMFYNNR
jgi:hypothetical protein